MRGADGIILDLKSKPIAGLALCITLNRCRGTNVQYCRKQHKRAIRDEIKEYKRAIGCFYGCKVFNPWKLHFHHLDPEQKTKNVSVLARDRQRAKAWTEIQYCVLVCDKCHEKLEEIECMD